MVQRQFLEYIDERQQYLLSVSLHDVRWFVTIDEKHAFFILPAHLIRVMVQRQLLENIDECKQYLLRVFLHDVRRFVPVGEERALAAAGGQHALVDGGQRVGYVRLE